MNIDHIEVFVEEPSMEAFLLQAMPRILPERISFSIYTHKGKYDLLRKLPDRLHGYSSWLPHNYGLAVIVDRDNDDCGNLKSRLEGFFAEAGISTKYGSAGARFVGITRIAIEELEAWYFGNWPAVRRCYPRLPQSVPSKMNYRNSDEVQGGTWEAFERVCKKSGVFTSGLRKVEAAREIGGKLEIEENTSPSLQILYEGLISLVEQT